MAEKNSSYGRPFEDEKVVVADQLAHLEVAEVVTVEAFDADVTETVETVDVAALVEDTKVDSLATLGDVFEQVGL